MADFCYYEIHVKGTKKACYAYYTTTPALEEIEILHEMGTDEDYIIHFSGVCKWSLDYYCVDEYEKELDLNNYTLDEIKENWDFGGLYSINPQTKSMVLNVIAEVYTYSEESGYKCFYKYEKSNLTFEKENFDWDFQEEEYVEELIWDKDEYPDFNEFLIDYDLENSDIKETDFKHQYDNIYIRPGNNYYSSEYFSL